MRVYRSKTLLDHHADFAQFARLFGAAVQEKSTEPFLLVRDDDARLLVVASDEGILLCLAHGPVDRQVSYASSYSEGTRTFRGLSRDCLARDENFVDFEFAIKAIHAFCDRRSLSHYVDFRSGLPEPEITAFPTPIAALRRVERKLVELRVDIPAELRTDMQAVCEYLDEVGDDPDENIDFDDAIQIGALCGGRIDRRRKLFFFSYHLPNGDVWDFKVPRTILDAIADGSLKQLTVMASIPDSANDAST